ncbi:unnamed protein product, partial [Owenia fusiformis]
NEQFSDNRIWNATIEQFYKEMRPEEFLIKHSLTSQKPSPFDDLPVEADPYVIDAAVIQGANTLFHGEAILFVFLVACQIFTLGEIRGCNYLGKSVKSSVRKGELSISRKKVLEGVMATHFPSLDKEEIWRLCREIVNRRMRYIFTECLDTFPWFTLR